MKKIIPFIILVLIAFSCTDLEDFNENKKDPASVSGESLFTGAQKNLVDQMVNTNVNTNIFRLIMQYWTETTYTDESNYDLTTRTIPDGHWSILYKDVLKDFDEAAKIIEATDNIYTNDLKQNKLAIIEIMNVYTWSVLVETFGGVPYTEALDIENLSPAYDNATTIYSDLLARLNTAIGLLDVSHGSFGDADNLYQGDIASWIKFANSLKLKMGIILADVNPTLSQTTVEAAASNVFTSNDDNATFTYLGFSPDCNPLYSDLVASGRSDFIPTETIVDTMNAMNDPRRQYYFTLYSDGTYKGGINGAGNTFSAFSHIADAIEEPTFEGDILDYAEVEFYLAEAVERGYAVGGSAEDHYNAAIEASILFWGGSDADVTAYLSQAGVAYSTAEGTWKQKIGTQSWIAFYNRGFEAWTQWRRLDYPVLVAPEDAVSVTPLRFFYPIEEQTLNGTEWSNAVDNFFGGEDIVDTRLFFDLH